MLVRLAVVFAGARQDDNAQAGVINKCRVFSCPSLQPIYRRGFGCRMPTILLFKGSMQRAADTGLVTGLHIPIDL